jgi:hypothetical protein
MPSKSWPLNYDFLFMMDEEEDDDVDGSETHFIIAFLNKVFSCEITDGLAQTKLNLINHPVFGNNGNAFLSFLSSFRI